MKQSDALIFTGHGVLNTGMDGLDAFLDQIAAIRDEYAAKKRDALDQMEMHAAQSDTKEVSCWSSEAERHGASVAAVQRVLSLAEAFLSELEIGPKTAA